MIASAQLANQSWLNRQLDKWLRNLLCLLLLLLGVILGGYSHQGILVVRLLFCLYLVALVGRYGYRCWDFHRAFHLWPWSKSKQQRQQLVQAVIQQKSHALRHQSDLGKTFRQQKAERQELAHLNWLARWNRLIRYTAYNYP